MLVKHAALLALGLAIGAWYGQPFAGLAAAAIVALAWHLLHLRRLVRWTRRPDDEPLPSDGGPWGAVFSNIHHIRQVATRLRGRQRELLERWRRITNALPDAGLLLDANFQIMQFNEPAQRMLALGNTNPAGLHITNILRNPSLVELIDSGDFDRAVRIVPATDPARTYLARLTPYGEDGYLLLIRDITDRERADRIKADFVGNASHELRTPLTVLNGYLTGMAEDASLDPQWREPVGEMMAQVARMQALVAGLMELNEFEARRDAPLIAADLGRHLRQACKDARQLAADNVEIALNAESGCDLLGDASALRSIVTNLLSNAVRFTPAGGRIEVDWWCDETGGHLRVRDSGIGIAPDDIERVTERFYRTDPGRARHHGGSGLGLAIVKHALSMHQAQLDIDSELEHGSTFTCHFPPTRVTAKHTG